jgi:hypothetical protein
VGKGTETYFEATIPAPTSQKNVSWNTQNEDFPQGKNQVHVWIFSKTSIFCGGELTCVFKAPGTDEPVVSYSSKKFFSSAFSALNYKHNNNIKALFQTCFSIFNTFMTETK